jgi:O-antigen/teichoic acid export membrane protein
LPEDRPGPRRIAAQGAGGLTASPRGRTLARNTLYSAVGEGSNLLLFLLGFLAARYLAPEAFGIYSTAFAFVGLFRILPDFGMSYAATLSISRERSTARHTVANLLGFQAALSVLTLALCLSIGHARYAGTTWIAVAVLSIDLVLKAWKSTLRWVLKSLERFGTEAVSLVLERVLLLAFGFASLARGKGVLGFVLVFLAVRAVDTAALSAYVHARVLSLRPSRDTGFWWELFRKGVPFAYAGVVITLFFQVDAVMLEAMRGAREVGYYRAPVLMLEGLTLAPRILGYALIPTMAAVAASHPETVTELYRRGSKYLLLAGLPVAAFGVIASGPAIRLLFGPDYAASVPAARWLIPAALFMFLSNFGETTLACINRWRAIVIVSTACLLLNIGLNLAWIPRLGYLGAAKATLLTEGAYFALTAAALRRYGHAAPWPALLVRPLAATGVFAGVLWACLGLPIVVAGALASVAYVLATFALGVWDRAEKDLMRGFSAWFPARVTEPISPPPNGGSRDRNAHTPPTLPRR